jgi:hypothetical protein
VKRSAHDCASPERGEKQSGESVKIRRSWFAEMSPRYFP